MKGRAAINRAEAGPRKAKEPSITVSIGATGCGRGAAAWIAAPIGTLGLNRSHPCSPSGWRHAIPRGEMEASQCCSATMTTGQWLIDDGDHQSGKHEKSVHDVGCATRWC